jgi:hemerythrin superfamily protein
MDKESFELIKESLEREIKILTQFNKVEEDVFFQKAVYLSETREKVRELEQALNDLKNSCKEHCKNEG